MLSSRLRLRFGCVSVALRSSFFWATKDGEMFYDIHNYNWESRIASGTIRLAYFFVIPTWIFVSSIPERRCFLTYGLNYTFLRKRGATEILLLKTLPSAVQLSYNDVEKHILSKWSLSEPIANLQRTYSEPKTITFKPAIHCSRHANWTERNTLNFRELQNRQYRP